MALISASSGEETIGPAIKPTRTISPLFYILNEHYIEWFRFSLNRHHHYGIPLESYILCVQEQDGPGSMVDRKALQLK